MEDLGVQQLFMNTAEEFRRPEEPMTVSKRIRQVRVVKDVDAFNIPLFIFTDVPESLCSAAVGRQHAHGVPARHEAPSEFESATRLPTVLPGRIKIRNDESDPDTVSAAFSEHARHSGR